jgi:hypothetical protein
MKDRTGPEDHKFVDRVWLACIRFMQCFCLKWACFVPVHHQWHVLYGRITGAPAAVCCVQVRTHLNIME